ncbi:aspartyl-phosphate phosphatase Spo0E family protein [Caldicoprobacter faecalis]|uniref:Spo0E like sporulation regulatory protein n=1 Tax=Caldicoprobacter faecalis TaxID=937334 RepID=A0A1I5X149_9FIRM|nr:aspartyl-phosphate phosphatase Spo0E family protein [Caldicoprobacter faecalis]SFQ25427.1 Spo0E like sporulation regulatory protein [Caldicoprobacter faecalis]
MELVTEINTLRQELHNIILKNQKLCSEPVVKYSQKLDKLIELYYSQTYNASKKGASKE